MIHVCEQENKCEILIESSFQTISIRKNGAGIKRENTYILKNYVTKRESAKLQKKKKSPQFMSVCAV